MLRLNVCSELYTFYNPILCTVADFKQRDLFPLSLSFTFFPIGKTAFNKKVFQIVSHGWSLAICLSVLWTTKNNDLRQQWYVWTYPTIYPILHTETVPLIQHENTLSYTIITLHHQHNENIFTFLWSRVHKMLIFGKWGRSRGQRLGAPLQTTAAYHAFHLGRLDKLQGKVMTLKLEWWIILMVDCLTHF